MILVGVVRHFMTKAMASAPKIDLKVFRERFGRDSPLHYSHHSLSLSLSLQPSPDKREDSSGQWQVHPCWGLQLEKGGAGEEVH